MQKLEERNTYTTTDIPHVSGNCDLLLNREETLSVIGLKTSSNNSDAALIAIFQRLDGTKIHASAKAKELTLLETANTFLISNLRRGTLLHTLKSLVSATPAPHRVL